MTGKEGLTRIPLPMLEQLLAVLERRRLECPFSEADLVDAGFHGFAADVVAAFAGFDADSVVAALRMVIAEPRSIDRPRYEQLLSLDFPAHGHHVLLRGPSGVGKRTLAQNLGQRALEKAKSVCFCAVNGALPDLLKQESLPAVERRLRRYTRPDILVLPRHRRRVWHPARSGRDLSDIRGLRRPAGPTVTLVASGTHASPARRRGYRRPARAKLGKAPARRRPRASGRAARPRARGARGASPGRVTGCSRRSLALASRRARAPGGERKRGSGPG